jgi:Flp pilus assembly pilin Flp
MFADALNSIITRTFLAMRREDGQTFVEYSMIGALVALLLVTVLGVFHDDIKNALTNIGTAL